MTTRLKVESTTPTAAHFRIYRPLTAEFARVGITETEYFVLSMLCIRDGLRR